MEKILGFIFARGGSKGVPGKNLRLLGGKPLIAHAIESALASQRLDRVVVSTDCPKIAQVAMEYGADVPFMRPQELATDKAPERSAWQHALQEMEALEGERIDVLVSIPPTCPLRLPEDVDQCVEELLQSDTDMVLTVTETGSNPYFNMITRDKQGYAHLAIKPSAKIKHRQDAPDVYDLRAVAYAIRRDPLLKYDSIFDSRARVVLVPQERAIDIDTDFDFMLAEFILDHQQSSIRKYRPAA